MPGYNDPQYQSEYKCSLNLDKNYSMLLIYFFIRKSLVITHHLWTENRPIERFNWYKISFNAFLR